MSARLALALGGTGSLGAYTAGAATEVLLALERNRAGPCSLGVVTGTSAGALSAALVARAVVRNPALLPWLERLWVEAMDVGVLLGSGPRDRAGLLDGGALEELTAALVAGDPASDDRPSPALGDLLRVGIGLTELAPPGAAAPPEGPADGGPDRHRSAAAIVEVELEAATPARDPAWERLWTAAVASASFPLLLPPRTLAGGRGGRAAPEEAGARSGPRDGGPYVDGGVLGPGPLEIAALLSRRDDDGSGPWHHLLVEPSRRRAAEPDAVRGGGAPAPPGPSMPEVAALLARAVPAAGAARDWRGAVEINARLRALEGLVERLPEIGGRVTDPEDFGVGRRIGELAERIAEAEVAEGHAGCGPGGAPPGPDAAGDPVVEHLDANLTRILEDPRYRPVLGRVETRAGRTRLAKLIFVLESAGGLRGRRSLPLHRIAPEGPEPLSGDFLGGFGGLLHRDWREADFRAGRRDARRVLAEELGEVVDYEPDPPEAYEVRRRTPSFDALPPDARRKAEAIARREADRALEGMRPGALASLLAWAWKPAVRRWATRGIMDAIRRAG